MKEEELLKKRLMELCEKAYNQNIYTYTHFLNEYEQSIYQDIEAFEKFEEEEKEKIRQTHARKK